MPREYAPGFPVMSTLDSEITSENIVSIIETFGAIGTPPDRIVFLVDKMSGVVIVFDALGVMLSRPLGQ